MSAANSTAGGRPRRPSRSREFRACGLASLDLGPLFHHMVVAAGAVCDAPAAYVLLFDDSAVYQEASLGSVVGGLKPSRVLTKSECSFRSLVLTRDVTDSQALCASELVDCAGLAALLGNFQTFLAGRIVSPAGLPIGCLCVCDPRERRYARSEVDTIAALAHHCSSILERLAARARARRDLGEFDGVDDQQRAQFDLAETEERMRVTLSSIGDAVVCTDPHGFVMFINPVAEEMSGWSAKDAMGRAIEEVMDLRDMASRMATDNPIRLALRDLRRVRDDPQTTTTCRRSLQSAAWGGR